LLLIATAAPIQAAETRPPVASWAAVQGGGYAATYAISPAGDLFACVDVSTSSVHMWDTQTFKLLWKKRVESGDGDVGLVFSPDGRRLACLLTDELGLGFEEDFDEAFGPADGFGPKEGVVLHDALTGKMLRRFGDVGTDIIYGVALSPDGRRLAIQNRFGGDVSLWDADKGRRIATLLPAKKRSLTALRFSPDGKRIVGTGFGVKIFERRGPGGSYESGGGTTDENYVLIWDVESPESVQEMQMRGSSAPWTVRFAPDGQTFALVSFRSVVRRLNVITSAVGELRVFDAEDGSIRTRVGSFLATSLVFADDGRTIVGAWHNVRELSVRICDLDSRRVRRTIQYRSPAGRSEMVTAAFSRNAAVLAVARSDGTIELWDVRTGRMQTVLEEDNRRFLGFATDKLWAPSEANPLTFNSNCLIAVKYFGDRSPNATGEDTEMRVVVWDVADYLHSPGESTPDLSEQSQTEPSTPTKSEPPATGHRLRTWSSADGRFRTQATLIRADSNTATLETADGRTIQVPLARLSAADQKYVREQSP
jgi:WD40 repeat protein